MTTFLSWLRPDPHSRVWWAWHAALVLVGLVVALAFGATTASARGSIGPHEAQFDVTTDALVTLDLGPLGTVELDSTLPLGLGVHVVVQEIPQEVTGLDQIDTLAALQEDLDHYIGFFAGVGTTVHAVAVRLIVNAAWRTLWAFVALVAAWWFARWVLGPTRREELVGVFRPYNQSIAVGTILVVMVGATFTGSERSDRHPNPPASAVFDGTPLAGARITGRLGGIIDTYSGAVVAAVEANDAFYGGVADKVTEIWPEPEKQIPVVMAPPGLAASQGPTPSGSATTSSLPLPRTRPLVPVVMVTDLHCNVGMARVIHTVAELSDAAVVVDAGDTTLNGTSVEEQCVQMFADAIPDGVQLIAVPGNHDSSTTSHAYAEAGAIVLHGKVVTVAGIRFFGDADPNQTLFGDTSSTRDETEEEAAERIADDVCELGTIDVLLIHNPRIASPSLQEGCVPVSLSGHLHARTDPLQVGGGIRYIGASSGGAAPGTSTLGPLHHTAELTVLMWDPSTRTFVSWQVVQVEPDGSVNITEIQPWPTIAVDPPAPAPEPTGGD